MTQEHALHEELAHSTHLTDTENAFVTVVVDGQTFGIPVLTVRDILKSQPITPVPLAPAEVAGSLNLRGRVVTAIDVRVKLGLEKRTEGTPMNVVVASGGELYSLIVDKVGDVRNLPEEKFERNPATLDERWRSVSQGIYRLQDELLIVFNVDNFLQDNQVKDR